MEKSRPPSDEMLFKHGLWAVTSFMAREGIDDYAVGIARYANAADAFHAKGKPPGSNAIQAYAYRKVRAKGRRFNTRRNRNDPEE